ncbi:hypothetical protein BURPS668_3767 [Burkholderia pseudomallei 668]|nr:hypothetical protein BURPS668_3767 [Burkholderia pseudomallei 668]
MSSASLKLFGIFFERADVVRPAPPCFSCHRIRNGAKLAHYYY